MTRFHSGFRSRLRVGLGLTLGLGTLVGTTACDPTADDSSFAEAEVARRVPDARLTTHLIVPGEPTPEGLAYLRAMADLHASADQYEGEARIQVLRRGLALPVPAGLAEAEIVRLDVAARLAEELMVADSGARAARELLVPMLRVEHSLPLDRSTARALVVLGDAAAKTGDDALAAGSYSRAIEMMSVLRQELEP